MSARRALLAAALAWAAPARAHHGGAAIGIAGPEGPGAAVETTSALPLPQGSLLFLAKSEVVPFQRFQWAEPTNKAWYLFDTLAVGYGLTPWLSLYLFQPVNAKSQDGLGTNAGPGDASLGLHLGFKYDEGLRLVPEKESLDELMDWHFAVSAFATAPVGPTGATGAGGAYYRPDMQTGFGSPSFQLGAAVLKQISPDLTFLADASYQAFLPHTYAFTRYQFGAELRADGALAWRALASPGFRLDLVAEASSLSLQRDRELDAAGAMAPLQASGGSVLYGGLGLRAFLGRFSAALGVRRAALRSLNEEAAQQGSEGLERFRATLSLSFSLPT